jgi:hypothetical protein
VARHERTRIETKPIIPTAEPISGSERIMAKGPSITIPVIMTLVMLLM